MSKELSQDALERLVVGTPPDPNVTFFEKPVLDMPRSRAENKRIYRKEVFVKKTHPGVTDWVAERATKEDIQKYSEQYEYFLNNRQGSNRVGVEVIPNLDITHLQELIDIGLSTIPALASAEAVPPHLEYARKSAVALNNVLEEQRNAQEENSEETRPGEDMPAPDRQEHPTDVERHEIQRRASSEAREAAERVHADRRINGGQSIDNWMYNEAVTYRQSW